MKSFQLSFLLLTIWMYSGSAFTQTRAADVYVVTGTVKYKKKIVPSASVQFRTSDQKIFSTKSDLKGNYKIELPSGAYHVFASGGRSDCQFAGCEPEFSQNGLQIGKKRKTRLNILPNRIGEG
jgi:hypothetical protein